MRWVVLDTNVLISGLLFRGPSRAIVDAALRGDVGVVTSPFLLDELENILVRKFSFSPEAATETRREVEGIARVVNPIEIPEVCRDVDDNQVLASADKGGAEAIITGDRDLLALHSHGRIAILKPATFLRHLQRQS